MATRRATRKFDSIHHFIDEYEKYMSTLSLSLPSDSYRGTEIASTIKLDLLIPDHGRLGPIHSTVVFRAPDGTVALQLSELPQSVIDLYDTLKNKVFGSVQTYIDSGIVVLKTEYDSVVNELTLLQEGLQDMISSAVEEALAQNKQIHDDEMEALRTELANRPQSDGTPSKGTFQRGFFIPDVKALSPMLKCNIAKEDYRQFLIQIASQELTGLMVFNLGETMRYGFYSKGGPVGWRSEPMIQSEVLGMLLLQAGQLSEDQIQESLRLMQDKEIRQGKALLDMGLITYPQLTMILGKQTEFILEQTLNLSSGVVEFYELEELPEQFITPKIKLGTILFRRAYQASRKLTFEELGRSNATHLNQYVTFSNNFIGLSGTLGLSNEERKLVDIIGAKTWRLREIFTISPLSKGKTSSFIYAFNFLGFFNYSDKEDGARSRERFLDRLKAMNRIVQRGSFFDILEIHWICLPQEIETAFQKKTFEFSDAELGDYSVEFENEINKIRKRFNEGYRTLKDDQSRRAYRITLIEKDLILNSADLLSKKGEMAIMRFDKREACACFSKALELVPNHKQFRDGLLRSTAITKM